ncbi:MFS transporter [Dactylosporangium sp. NBC_01737]|uniref:MFS transporter n=1 Tax=Dactylosporangium sp. NBC_01737 TaxID=2975959 RepID=UPI002E0D3D32|nr:MFS transporter [Dactylosporangium sp. NBC_01737]
MRQYGVFLLISAATAFGSACAYTLNLVYQIRTAGLGPLQLVLVGTALEVVYLLAQLPSGRLADLRGRRPAVLLGVGLTGAGTVLQGVAPTFTAILAGTVLWGVGAACFDGAFEAWAADELGEDRIGAVLTRGAQVGQACTVLGMLTAIGLATRQLWLPIVVGGAVWLALAGFLALAMRERHFQPVPPVPGDRTGLRAARRSPVLLALAGATLFVALGREGYDRLSQDHLLHAAPPAGPAVVWLGALAVAGTLLAIPLTELLRRRTTGLPLRRLGRLLIALQAVQVAAIAVFALTGRFVEAAAAFLLAGVLRAAADPLWTTWLITQTAPASRATVLSAVGMVGALGEIAGGPPVGWIGQRFSVGRALLVCSLLTAPAVALLSSALSRGRSEDAKVQA